MKHSQLLLVFNYFFLSLYFCCICRYSTTAERASPQGVVARELDQEVVVSDVSLQSPYSVHF